MKIPFLLFLTLIISVSVSAQKAKKSNDLVKVAIQGTDASVIVNTIDLIGIWNNISSTSPILSSPFSVNSIEITNSHMVNVKDTWKEDYANKMNNCTWAIVDRKFQLRSPDLGRLSIEIEKLQDSNLFELTLNNVTYRKLVNISSN